MTREMTCIICPRGCTLTVDLDQMSVTGNTCPKGEQYAIDECTHPVRTVTSTVRLSNREGMVSVKTENPIPKDQIFAVMEQIRHTAANAPVHIGDVLIPDAAGSAVIATKNVE